MAEVCIFNPWHDMALAYGRKPFTPPQIAVKMYERLKDIADLWNDESGYILPWGWDYYTKRWLVKQGYDEGRMPADKEIEHLRDLSNRKTYIPMLEDLRKIPGTVGEAHYVTTIDAVDDGMVVKAPWSSSGRGVRVYTGEDEWLKKIISRQGGVMVEPYYEKVKDFAMEFMWDGLSVEYLGLSLFRNVDGRSAYDGNIVASEERKMRMLEDYVQRSLVDEIRERIKILLKQILNGLSIATPLGVDMMIVRDGNSYAVHPCVEVNLRRTMGYVAIKIYERKLKEKQKYDTENEEDNIAFFNVDAAGGKWTVCQSGVESGQW